MKAAKIDANQNEIVKALRKAGYSVQILSAVGKGCPDLAVGIRGKTVLVELKDGTKIPSKQALTYDQLLWHKNWKGAAIVAFSFDDAISKLNDLT